MSKSSVGLIAGILLALAAVIGGWSGFLLALVLGAVGLAVGAQLDGSVDLPGLFRGRQG